MAQNITQEFQVYTLDEVLDSGPCRAFLCDGTNWSSPPTPEQIFASEIAPGNGYSRQTATPATPAVWNSTNNRAERSLQDFSISASGANLSYSAYAVAINGSTESSKVATASSANNRITATAHGLANGDKVMLTADTGGSVPTGLNALIRYHASVVDANTIELYTDEALTTLAPFTSDGTGTLRLRYANGIVCLAKNIGTTRTVPDGQTRNFGNLIVYAA